MSDSTPNNIDYSNNNEYPTDPDTLNYNYSNATYSKPRPFDSNYSITNYDNTNYPKTDYNKFNASLTNFNKIKSTEFDLKSGYLPLDASNYASLDTIKCESPDMLYQVPRDRQYNNPDKYVCFNNQYKLVEIIRQNNEWVTNDLTKSPLHIKWQGAQCKINTDVCSRDKLTENCEATCYVSPNDAFTIKYQNSIWRRPDLEAEAGPCTMTAISEDTAMNSYCKCDNVLERPKLMTKPVYDKDFSGKFWCSS